MFVIALLPAVQQGARKNARLPSSEIVDPTMSYATQLFSLTLSCLQTEENIPA